MMAPWEKRLRNWFRKRGYSTYSGGCYGQVYFWKKDESGDTIEIEVNPVMFPENIHFYADNKSFLLPIEDLKNICFLAERNQDRLEEIRNEHQ